MRLYLHELHPNIQGQPYPLSSPSVVRIGSEHQSGHIYLTGEGVEAVHCEIIVTADGVQVRNLSRTGTTLNTESLRDSLPHRVELDDLLGVGKSWFRLVAIPFVCRQWLHWRHGLIRQMAAQIDRDRDFTTLPVLADALEEAGCADRNLLEACRNPGVCPRGSSVVDALLERTTMALDGDGRQFPRTAILSDIHSNLEALQAVLAHMEGEHVEQVFCLGDFVGYGPNPRECVDILSRVCKVALLGNHDVATFLGTDGFGPFAERAVLWTRQFLESDPSPLRETRLDYLAGRPRSFVAGPWLFVHGSPRDPLNEYFFPEDIYNQRKMDRNFALVSRCCFQGHTHLPGVFLEDVPGETYSFHAPEELDNTFVLEGRKTMVNVGSVGQPRDGDRRACYTILDGQTVTFHRVEYDIEATARKIRDNPDLENFLGDRLRDGR